MREGGNRNQSHSCNPIIHAGHAMNIHTTCTLLYQLAVMLLFY